MRGEESGSVERKSTTNLQQISESDNLEPKVTRSTHRREETPLLVMILPPKRMEKMMMVEHIEKLIFFNKIFRSKPLKGEMDCSRKGGGASAHE